MAPRPPPRPLTRPCRRALRLPPPLLPSAAPSLACRTMLASCSRPVASRASASREMLMATMSLQTRATRRLASRPRVQQVPLWTGSRVSPWGRYLATWVTPHRRAFASRNCVISGADPCELVRTCANPSRIRGELA
eukprot:7387923-Prymnesium_polylepis.1